MLKLDNIIISPLITLGKMVNRVFICIDNSTHMAQIHGDMCVSVDLLCIGLCVFMIRKQQHDIIIYSFCHFSHLDA